MKNKRKKRKPCRCKECERKWMREMIEGYRLAEIFNYIDIHVEAGEKINYIG